MYVYARKALLIRRGKSVGGEVKISHSRYSTEFIGKRPLKVQKGMRIVQGIRKLHIPFIFTSCLFEVRESERESDKPSSIPLLQPPNSPITINREQIFRVCKNKEHRRIIPPLDIIIVLLKIFFLPTRSTSPRFPSLHFTLQMSFFEVT